MDFWVVVNGEPFASHETTEDKHGVYLWRGDWYGQRLWREDYGAEWIAVNAHGADAAIVEAARFDTRTHPAQVEMELFADASPRHA